MEPATATAQFPGRTLLCYTHSWDPRQAFSLDFRRPWFPRGSFGGTTLPLPLQQAGQRPRRHAAATLPWKAWLYNVLTQNGISEQKLYVFKNVLDVEEMTQKKIAWDCPNAFFSLWFFLTNLLLVNRRLPVGRGEKWVRSVGFVEKRNSYFRSKRLIASLCPSTPGGENVSQNHRQEDRYPHPARTLFWSAPLERMRPSHALWKRAQILEQSKMVTGKWEIQIKSVVYSAAFHHVNSIVLTKVPWWHKLLTSENLGKGYIGILCNICA